MSSEKQRFANRLNDILTDADLPRLGGGRQSAFARMLEVSPRQAGSWLKGEDFPPTSVLVRIARTFNVRSNWLLSGSGSKYEDVHAGPDWIPENPEKRGKFNKEAFKVAMAWMKLTEAQRKLVNDLIRELSHQNGK